MFGGSSELILHFQEIFWVKLKSTPFMAYGKINVHLFILVLINHSGVQLHSEAITMDDGANP